MRTRMVVGVAAMAIALSCISSVSSLAQCADVLNSQVPGSIVVCPSGDLPTNVLVLDAVGNPCINEVITMAVIGPAACLGGLCFIAAPVVAAVTNLAGVATFLPAWGGCCPNAQVQFTDAFGQVLGIAIGVTSPDQDASCAVTLPDVSIFAVGFGGGWNPCLDLTADGAIGLGDVAVMATHIGH